MRKNAGSINYRSSPLDLIFFLILNLEIILPARNTGFFLPFLNFIRSDSAVNKNTGSEKALSLRKVG